jgi:large subunit ribosomal protein L30
VTAARSRTASSDATAWLRVTQVRSAIGVKPKHRGTLRALGLRGIGRSNLLPDRPEIRGMLARVPHLIEVTPAESGSAKSAKSATSATSDEKGRS